MRWPKGTRTSIDGVEAQAPLVRVVRDEDWEMLMDELRELRGERAAVVAWLREHWSEVLEQTPQQTAKLIERGEHRREEKL